MNPERRETILVVDDEENIRDVVSEFFRRRGYQVLTAGDGIEALALLGRVAVDCCFTDISMPRMGGLELAARLREADNTVPVIVMTAYPSLENSIRTLKNGVVDFLIKPVDLRQMELSLQRVLRQREILVENLMLKNEVKGKQRLEELNRELLSRIEELDTANRILKDFSSTASSEQVFKRTVDVTREVIKADTASFFVIDESLQRPHRVAVAGRSSGPPPGDNGLSGRLRDVVMGAYADGIPLLASGGCDPVEGAVEAASLMALPVKIRDKVFGVLTAERSIGGRPFAEKDLFYVSVITQSAASSIETLALYENTYENLFATLYAFVKALEARDLYTRQHSVRVTGIAITLGRELGCSDAELEVLHFAGHLHDIGKIGIRDDILLKPSRLSADEFEKIKTHPAIGADILNQLGLWDRERQIIRCHHERFDGTGYPDGLRGEGIPFLARILSVADAYDAMDSDRAYRNRMEMPLILRNIAQGAGTQFDPDVVAAFQKAVDQGRIHAGSKHEDGS